MFAFASVLASWTAAAVLQTGPISAPTPGAIEASTPDKVVLQAESKVEGEIRADSESVRTASLDSPARGVRLRLEINAPGPVTINLRSYFFDTYLVLLDSDGALVAEDDNGLVATQSRVVAHLDAGRYVVWACSPSGQNGPFQLETSPGSPPPATVRQRLLAEIEDARRTAEARSSAGGPNLWEALDHHGFLLYQHGRYSEAALVMNRALEVAQSTFGHNDPRTAKAQFQLAAQYEKLGRYADAEDLYSETLLLLRASLGEDHLDTARVAGNLAVVYYIQGRYAEAESLHLRALDVREAALGPDDLETANSLHNLALLYAEQRRDSEAKSFFARALAITESALGERHPLSATCLVGLGAVHQRRGENEQGLPYFRRALSIRREALGDDHPDTANTLNNLAVILSSLGQNAEAQSLFAEAIRIKTEALGREHPITLSSVNNLAGLHEDRGDEERAAELLERVLEGRRDALGQAHPDTANSFAALASSLDRRGEPSAALENTLKSMDCGQAWVIAELLRVTSDRRFLSASAVKGYLEAAISRWLRHPEPRPPLDLVYRRACAWKGVVLRSVSRLSRVLAERENDEEVRRLRHDLANLEGQLSSLTYAEKIADPESHETRLMDVRERRRAAQRELFSLLGLAPAQDTTSAGELSRLLPERSAALDFLIHDPGRRTAAEPSKDGGPIRDSDKRVLCFVTIAREREPVLVDLGDATPLRNVAAKWLDEMTHGRRGDPVQTAVGDSSAAELVRERLADPILKVLPSGTTRLFVVPDDFVGELPFEAISVGDNKFLLELLDIVYATDPVSLRVLLESEPDPIEAAPSILAVGGVDYEARTPVAIDRSGSRSRGSSHGFSRTWGPLSSTSVEVDGLATQALAAWPSLRALRILKSRDATEEAVKALAPGRTILHFATHGFFQRQGFFSLWKAALRRANEDPEPRGLGRLSEGGRGGTLDPFAVAPPLTGEEPGLMTGLVLAGANLDPASEPDRDDGVLTSTEVSSLDLSSCHLAMLSACQTSVGVGESGEGLQSLRRGFHEAGARTVVASLWRVDDTVTQRLMHKFYEGLWIEGRGVGDALRRAKLSLLSEQNDPYYWAAFTLSGDWR